MNEKFIIKGKRPVIKPVEVVRLDYETSKMVAEAQLKCFAHGTSITGRELVNQGIMFALKHLDFEEEMQNVSSDAQ